MRKLFLRSLLMAFLSGLILHAQIAHAPTTAARAESQSFAATRLHRLSRALEKGAKVGTSADCLVQFGIPCYSPKDIRKAYGIDSLLKAGYTGFGQTIVVVVSYGSPTIEQDLKKFDAEFALPDPPAFTVLAPLGTVPFDSTDPQQLSWAGETSLDVEWAHAIAPEASIVLLTSPVDETQGVQGLPEFLKLEEYALDHHLGQIISQSWGTTENTLFTSEGRKVLNDFEQFYRRAAKEGVTVLAASGDSGTENVDVNNNPYPFQTVLFPASSPEVTAVGGTSLYLDSKGGYQSETVWNNDTGASGGGISQYFAEPFYQSLLPLSSTKELRGARGIPDVAANADPNTPLWVYFGFYPNPADNGFYAAGAGTSAAAPQWAGIVADANQLAGHPLGFLNPKLYAILAAHQQNEFFHDITTGSNGFNGLPGYEAVRGWDLASGAGTPNFGELVWELCRLW